MRSIEEKGCLNEESAGSSCMILELKKSGGGGGVMSRPSPHHRSSLGKATPSKWDDAQKWLVNLSRGEKNEGKGKGKGSPRKSNADDRRLIAAAPKREWAGQDEDNKYIVETKNVECDDEDEDEGGGVRVRVRGICLRDMGTDMTPIGSKEPSRSASPVVSRKTNPTTEESTGHLSRETNGAEMKTDDDQSRDRDRDRDRVVLNPLEARAAAWEEAERAKYMARYKREDVRIQAWENHEKKKAEMQNRKVEVKAEQMKSRAKEKCNHRIAAIDRIGEEKRAVAEAKLNDNAMKNSKTADYIRRNGHLPYFFSFKLPSTSPSPSRCCYC